MDFNDTPEEAAFRAEARAFLDQHMELRGPDDAAESAIEQDDPETIRAAQESSSVRRAAGTERSSGIQ